MSKLISRKYISDKYSVSATESDRKEICTYYPLSDNIKIFWNTAMGKDCNGAFTPFKPNAIFLTSAFKAHNDKGIKRLIPTLAHKMVHRRQFMEDRLKYMFQSMRWVRKYTIEPEAERVEAYWNKKLEIKDPL